MSVPQERIDFVLSHIESFFNSRAPFRPPLPADLVAWLNAPALDLSSHIHTRPTLSGSRPCLLPKQLTRLMAHAWRRHAKHFDVFQETGFYGFLTWYAIRVMKDWNLPSALLPEAAVELLNLSAADEAVPLTLCMLMNERAKGVDLRGGMPAEKMYAAGFKAVGDLLILGDVRLVPPFVSQFWREHAIPGESVTTYEYVAAAAHGALKDYSIVNAAAVARNWFISDYLISHPWAASFTGDGVQLQNGNPDRTGPKPISNAVLSYRDHKTVCGLSKAGVHATNALRSAGFEVFEFDYALPRDRMQEEYRHNTSILANSVRNLHLLNINAEYVPECLLLNSARVKPGDYIIGQFYWELSDTSKIHETGMTLVDEIWVASSYLADVFSQRTDKPVINVGQAVNQPAPVNLGRRYFGLPENVYLFLVTFDAMSSIERKNPLAAVRAFREAFPKGSERAGLVVKTRHADRVGGADLMHWNMVVQEAQLDRRIRIIDRTMTEEEITGLLNACDCYVTLHRSEGFGYGAAEALMEGKPVITTGYSGVCDFCTEETSLPVPYTLSPVEAGTYPYMDVERSYLWAIPDVHAASDRMQSLFKDPAKGVKLGERGQHLVRTEYSLRTLSKRYEARLKELGFHPTSSGAAAKANGQ